MTMAEIRLLFTAADDAWAVQHVFEQPGSPPARGDIAPLTFDLDDDQHADLRWYLEGYMDLPDHGSRVRAERIEGEIDTWGRTLYDDVFGPQANANLLGHLLAGDVQPRLTVATDDAHVLRLPWELLADQRGPLARRVNIRRQLESAGEGDEFRVGLPLRILLVVSRPDDLGFIGPRLTTRSILDALLPLGEENVAVDFCRPPTLARMDELLTQARQRGEPYAIVHFDGHGTYDAVLGLCFERAAAPDQPHQALDQGRAALIAQPHRWIEPGPGGRTVALQDWYLPQLYQRGDDLVLVQAGQVHQQAPTPQRETSDDEPFDIFGLPLNDLITGPCACNPVSTWRCAIGGLCHVA
jgi:hypothetical protein